MSTRRRLTTALFGMALLAGLMVVPASAQVADDLEVYPPPPPDVLGVIVDAPDNDEAVAGARPIEPTQVLGARVDAGERLAMTGRDAITLAIIGGLLVVGGVTLRRCAEASR